MSRNDLLQLLTSRVKFLCLGHQAEISRLYTTHLKTQEQEQKQIFNYSKETPSELLKFINVLVWKTSFSFQKDQNAI